MGPKELMPLEKPETNAAPVAPPTPPPPPPVIHYVWGSQTDIIEGCDYIKWGFNDGNFTYIHRGDCRKCWEKWVALSFPAKWDNTNSVFSGFDKVITVNGCQYSVCFGSAISFCHLGTCTNCWARMENLIRKVVNEGH